MKTGLCATLALGVTLASGVAHAESIRISYLPSLYWALPFYVASEKGWWAEVDLEPEFVTFPAGAPQIAAAQAKDWDVGGTGSVPAILGASRFGLKTIGLTNDESRTNAIMTSKADVAAVKADPSAIKSLLLTTNSTADFTARACLEKWGVDPKSVEFVNLAQAQIISAVISGNGRFAAVWAPNTYTLQERADYDYLCSGADAGAVVPGALVARDDYATSNPEQVQKFLAVYLKSIRWIKENPDEAKDLLVDFYYEGGVEISDAGASAEFELRPTFTLDEQVALMARDGGSSEMDGWFTRIAEFMTTVGTITQAPDATSYIDPGFMQVVKENPELVKFVSAD
ncbi:ABC transporter substrate-binding protein [Paracoccus laeviglucosivorans]|uniref:NitT/TauT family transport system substrate-binding protein n=1 Tax=Paracoccus laeviglucosivorans TaxID=1197861 RepID=A0A521FMN0_9RHOB|nr:ABC transporter substrate-binding protein [Paracoccus laeviglucosivorans]SMO97447.1 NitT/TauT family transport system substrate-binding protein [Paracoccus laeviglucosivorans]